MYDSGVDILGLMWDKLHEEKKSEESFTGFSGEVGVVLPDSENYYRYYVGARIAKPIKNEKYLDWELTPGEYVVCTFEAENFDALVMDALYKAQQYLFDTWCGILFPDACWNILLWEILFRC